MRRFRTGNLVLGVMIAAGSAPAAWAQSCANPNQPLTAIRSTHTIPPYPQLSQLTGEQGTTQLKIAVGADGVATDVQVTKSSGSLRLDSAAQDYVKATYRWNPQIKSCNAVASVTEINIVWDLRNAAPDPRILLLAMNPADYPADAMARQEQGVVGVVIYIAANDTLINAVVARSSGFPDLDAKALEVAKKYHWAAVRMDGRAVASSVFANMAWTLPPTKPP